MAKIDILIAIPLLGGLAVIQSAVLSRTPLIMGTADVLLLTIMAWSIQDRVKTAWQWSAIGGLFASFGSALPYGVLLISYLAVTGVAQLIRKRVWKIPLLGMFIMSLTGSAIVQVVSILSRVLSGVTVPLSEAINLIIIPTLMLNFLLTIPIYIVITDLAGWLYREEIRA